MLRPRVIPCLLLKDGGLVKTVRFRQSKYVGDPINAVKLFNDLAVDELLFLDITATPEGAKGSVYLLIVNVGVQPPAIISASKYDDTLVKTPQGWRFKKRVVNNEAPPSATAQ